MTQTTLAVKDANNSTQSLSTVTDPTNSGAQMGVATMADPVTGNKANIAAFHTADNQQPGGTAYGILAGGVAQLLNVAGNLDRQRSTGIDGVPSVGIPAGAASFAMSFKTSIASAITLNASPQTVTPAAMSGTVGGVPWSIQTGGVVIVDSGGNQEAIYVTAVTGTTFTGIFTKNHSSNVVVRGFVFNQERDAAGEADGATGIGTAVAAEYEFNGGAPGGGNFDRARSLQAKGKTTATISAGGGSGSTSLTISAAGTLKAGTQVLLYKAANFPSAGYFETAYVDFSYTEGSTTVPLASAIVNAVTYDTIAYDSFSATGPGLNGFLPIGVGIEEEALYDPVTGLFFIERAATADACAPQNVVLENPGLYNGATIDRARSAPGALGAALVSSDGAKATYRYASLGSTPAATPTDLLTLAGSGTKTVRVKTIKVSGLATTAGQIPVSLVRRSAVNTGGTSTNPTAIKHDINDAAATAVLALYTVNPTGLGTAVGNVGAKRLFLNVSTAQEDQAVWDFSTRQDKALVLRGTTDILALNFGGAAVPAGGVLDFEIEWEEDNS
jgi:hypothetical protein